MKYLILGLILTACGSNIKTHDSSDATQPSDGGTCSACRVRQNEKLDADEKAYQKWLEQHQDAGQSHD